MNQISPAKTVKLDQKDKKILSILIENCRQPLSQIARKVRLSRASVEYRIRRLEERGLITGYKTVIDTARLGYKKSHLFLSFPQPQQEREFLQRARENPAVNSILTYRGTFTVEASITAKNDNDLQTTLQVLLAGLKPNQEAFLIILDTIKSAVLPQQQQLFKKKSVMRYVPDKFDGVLCQLLAENAALTTTELAHQSGLSRDVVAYRLKKLTGSNYLTHFRPAFNYSCLGLGMQTILLKANYDLHLSLQLEQFIQNFPEIIWAAKTLGHFNYILYLLTENQEQFHTFFEQIKERFGEIISSYNLLTVHTQEKYSFLAKNVRIE